MPSSNSPSLLAPKVALRCSGQRWESHSALEAQCFREGRKLRLKRLVYQWLTRPRSEGLLPGRVKAQAWVCSAQGLYILGSWNDTAWERFLCAKRFRSPWGIPHGLEQNPNIFYNNTHTQFYTAESWGWQISRLHSRRRPLKSHVQLSFALWCAHYNTFLNYLNTCYFSHFLWHKGWLGLTESVCGLYYLVTL